MGIFLKNDYPGFAELFFFIYLPPLKAHCPDGEIGRHASLRGWFRLRCASSSLVLGTEITKPTEFQWVLLFPGARIGDESYIWIKCVEIEIFRFLNIFIIVLSPNFPITLVIKISFNIFMFDSGEFPIIEKQPD